jgi:hypothetical protein
LEEKKKKKEKDLALVVEGYSVIRFTINTGKLEKN